MCSQFYDDDLTLSEFKNRLECRKQEYAKKYKINNYPYSIPEGYIERYYDGLMVACLRDSEFGPERIKVVREVFPKHKITWIRSKLYSGGEEDPAMMFVHNKPAGVWNRFWWSPRWTWLENESIRKESS